MSDSGNGNITKIHKVSDYTIIDNGIFKDTRISLKAKGLLSMMLSFSDNWEFSVSGLSKLSKDGIDSVRSGLDELEKNGYLIREYTRQEGKFSGTVFHIYEKPNHIGLAASEKPYADKPTREIQHNKELSNKVLNDKLSSNNTIVDFDSFWNLYPKKVGKGQAIKTFNKLIKDDETFNLIINDLEKRKQCKNWLENEGKFIPHPSTYLNNMGWLDEYELIKKEVKKEIGNFIIS